MRLYTTDAGIAKAQDETTLALLDLPYPDIGALLAADPELNTVAAATTKPTSSSPIQLSWHRFCGRPRFTAWPPITTATWMMKWRKS